MVTAGSGMRVPKPRAGIWPEALARGMRVRRMSGEPGIRWASRGLVNQVGSGMHEIFEGGAEIKNQIEIGSTPGQAGAQQCCAPTNLLANGRVRRASVRMPRRERFPGLLRGDC